MQQSIDSEKTIMLIEKMKLARIGEYNRWESLIKKIQDGSNLNTDDFDYFSNFTRIYKNAKVSHKSKIYHTKLSEEDKKPPCKECGEDSLYYCNMNDIYFCAVHIVGHDDNEL